ncbi:SafA/ExsA family spore coat assembly protein [Clostridium lundense]|uniref:SafA/ExsA family spore coat assembly protein n=1 Tax=Clostridium lundense TaxID=319475 RepID=UPI0004813422|nr:SafA/ExsA family spore coat assembly protein [Clostridium lundense]
MIKKIITAIICTLCISTTVFAAPLTYTVQSGDSLWKIAVKNQVGISELIAENPQLKNPSLIYPGQKISIPNMQDVKTQESEVVRLVNIERSKNGLPALKENWEVSRIARYKSQDMINKSYFSHTSPTYGSPFTMMESFGIKFSAAGENIAMGQRTPQEVVTAWMNSPGHRSNILSPNFSQIGVGLAKDKNGICYWTQMFIKPLY